MTRRLLVSGAGGFVAGSVVKQAAAEWEVHALSRGPALLKGPGLHWHRLDMCSATELRTLVAAVKPDAVIHTAAIADIDYSEAHREEAHRVNVGMSTALAEGCTDVGARLVYCSTDNAFDGARGMYTEADPPSPVNYYGETKVEAEGVVRARCPDAIVARVALVTGLHVLGTGNSFLARMMASFEAGKPVGVPEMEIRTTIDVITLGRALLELAANASTGTVHLSGNDRLNRYEMVRRIAARLGYSADLVRPSDPSGIPGRARRPVDVSLDNGLARRTLGTSMVGLEDGLERILAGRENLMGDKKHKGHRLDFS